ncbi:LysR substrate-binding domain-containing protein [uncultured Massilia sp.]|uniref:LysR substrate-binding domain-containing protein n=1 Tax=uncultured Massilia sp. TaxID=169973 RepID=UPI0025E869FA|nr:LysR substrate-binding domain-containing protein [uncultured Massilia sp.]
MDFDSLKIFRTVAAELSITQAAVRLGRAPSNVTTRIQQLEAEFGEALFVRTGKRMTLSGAGTRLLDYAGRLLALEEEARHVVSGGRDGGALRIGSMESTAASRLPALLAGYHLRHPGTRLELGTGPSRQLVERLLAGQIDCAFAALPPALGGASGLAELGLRMRPVWTEALLLLLPASEAHARDPRALRVRSLAAFPAGCTYRQRAEELLGIAATPGWTIQEMASYHAMVACVAAGACVTVLPASVLALANAPAGLATLDAGRIDTCLLWRDGYDVPAFRALVELVDPVT